MAVAFDNGVSAGFAAANAASITSPTGIVAGDYLLCFLNMGSGGQVLTTWSPGVSTGATDWTILAANSWGQVLVGKKAADADANAANFTFGWTGTAAPGLLSIVRITGVSVVPLEAMQMTEFFGTPDLWTRVLTPFSNDDIAFSFSSVWSASGGVPVITIPGTLTDTGLGITDATNNLALSSAYELLTTNDPTTARAITTTNPNDADTVTVLLRAGSPFVSAGGGKLLPGYFQSALDPFAHQSQVSGRSASLYGITDKFQPGTLSTGIGMLGIGGGGASIGMPNYSGVYKVVGHTYEGNTGVPIGQRRVFLSSRHVPSLILREAVTQEDGSFVFLNIAPGVYDVVAMNQDNSEDDVVHAVITAVPM